MNNKGYNWLISAVAVALTLAALTGGQMLWQKFTVVQPMDKLFQGIDGVTKSSWEEGKRDDVVQIYITLAETEHFPKTYSSVYDGARRILGGRPFRIHIADSRTDELEQFYHKIHYQLQEAVFTGNFSIMAEKTQKMANEAGVTACVYVETKIIYVHLTKGQNELYAVVTR